jgi:hypothetical protein
VSIAVQNGISEYIGRIVIAEASSSTLAEKKIKVPVLGYFTVQYCFVFFSLGKFSL